MPLARVCILFLGINSILRMNDIILIKFASRSRPEKFFFGLDNIINQANQPDKLVILGSFDKDDQTMFNKEVLTRMKPYVEKGILLPVFGTSISKIDAINRDMDKAPADWKYLINFSDDMEFTVKGYDDIIRQKFALHFSNGDGNLHFYDGYQDRVSTMSIMDRIYFNRSGTIYNPEYKSLFCDEEYTEIARQLGKIQYIREKIFVHKHAVNTGQPKDELLVHTESFYKQDEITYRRRHAANFGLVLA